MRSDAQCESDRVAPAIRQCKMQRGVLKIIDLERINLQITDTACPLGEKNSTLEVHSYTNSLVRTMSKVSRRNFVRLREACRYHTRRSRGHIHILSPRNSDSSCLNPCQQTHAQHGPLWGEIRKRRTYLLGSDNHQNNWVAPSLKRINGMPTESNFHVSISVLRLWPVRRPTRMLQRRAYV